MTNPVTRAGAKPITYNEALSAGAGRTFAEEVPVREPPPPAVERATRKKEALGGVMKAAKHVAEHKAAHNIGHNAGAIASAVGKKAAGLAPVALTLSKAAPGAAMLALMKDAFSVISGPPSMNETGKARVREHFAQATALMAQSALPRAYVQARVVDEAAARGRLSDALENLQVRLKSPEKAEAAMVQFKKEAEQSAFQGMEFAAAYQLRSPAGLDGLLAKDPSFRDRFDNDLAFQEGVRAMVWVGQNNPKDFEARSALFATQKGNAGASAR